jgi:hypothetical protein
VDTPLPVTPDPGAAAGDERGRTALVQVREQLREILTLLDRNDRKPA